VYGPLSATVEHFAQKISNDIPINCRVYRRASTWYRSTGEKLRNEPLPYSMALGIVDFTAGKNQSCDAASELGYTTLVDSRWNNLNNSVSNRALAKFVSSAQDNASAQLGETLGEWGQSRDMLAARFTQLAGIARSIKRRDWKGLQSWMGKNMTRRERRSLKDSSKSQANLWMEFHLGWEPLIGDIYGALEALKRDPSPRRCRGKASANGNYEIVSTFATSKQTQKVGYGPGCVVQGKVHVVNPNIALLASLGLINPAGIAWALMPYSFVIDWFVNVAEFTQGLDGLLGCETRDPFVTTLRRGLGVKISEVRPNVNTAWELNTQTNSRGLSCNRVRGLPSVHFTYCIPPRFSWQRAATAAALLLKFI
jgi:hypothetical protein